MNRQVSEKSIEDYLRLRVKQMGGRAYKFVSPGNAGVPDRLVALPGGRIAFVELKAPGKKPTPLQMKKMRELLGFGFISGWADSKEGVERFLDRMRIPNDDHDAVLLDMLEAGGQL